MNKKYKLKGSLSLLTAVAMVFGIFFAVPLAATSSTTQPIYTFNFTPEEQTTQESLFRPRVATSTQVDWVSGEGIGDGDNYVLKGTHIGTSINSTNNSISLVLPEPLPAGVIYNVKVSFYVPSELNEGKTTITGPCVVLNGAHTTANLRFPRSATGASTIAMDIWKKININTPLMTSELSSIDFRFYGTSAATHPSVWYIDNIVITEVGVPSWDLTLPSLAEIYKDSFPFGNIISPHELNSQTTEMYKHHYNIVTAENHMKPNTISNAKGVYNFDNADAIVNWAEENNFKVHGHALVWHSQSPNWLYRDDNSQPLTRNEARENMEEYITRVAGRYSGRLISWDVVNEALDGGRLPFDNWKDVARANSPWYRAYANGADPEKGEHGADYIYDAFVFARLADPHALLEYNDYNETDDWKREAMAQMADDLNAKWLEDPRNTDPGRKLIESLGMQSHHHTQWPNVSEIEASIQRFIQAGVQISVSELDVPYGGYNGPHVTILTHEQQVEQAIYYARAFEYYKAYDGRIHRLTIWGKADSQSWRGFQSPVLFDDMFTAKEAFYAVADPSGYLARLGLTPRSLHDLTVSASSNTMVAGLPASFTVNATAADLTNYRVVAYLAKDGVKCGDEFRLVNGAAKVTIPSAPAAGQYSILVDAYDGETLFASKAIPMTVEVNNFEVTVNGTSLDYTLNNNFNAIFAPTSEQLNAILSGSQTISIDLSGDSRVTGIEFTVRTEPFRNVDKTLEFRTAGGRGTVKTKAVWNNSGKLRVITFRGKAVTLANK
jgi:GH35 family endo-1,4-beta-xylanase